MLKRLPHFSFFSLFLMFSGFNFVFTEPVRQALPPERRFLTYDKSCADHEEKIRSYFSKAFLLADQTSFEFAKSRSSPARIMYRAIFSPEETAENDELGETERADWLYDHVMRDRVSTYVKDGSRIRPDQKNWNAFIIEIFFKVALFATDKVPYETAVFCDLTRFRKVAYRQGGNLKYYIVDRTFPKTDETSQAMMKYKEVSKGQAVEDSLCQETLAFMYQGPAESNFKDQIRVNLCPSFFDDADPKPDYRPISEINAKGILPGPLKNSLDGLLPREATILHELIHAISAYFKDQASSVLPQDPIISDYAYRFMLCKDMRKHRGIATFLNAASYEHIAKGIGLSGLKAATGGGKLRRKTKGPVTWDDGIIDPMTGESFDEPWKEWTNGLAEFERIYPADQDAMFLDKRKSDDLAAREVTKSASGNQCHSSLHCEDLLCASENGKICAHDFFAPCPCKSSYEDSVGEPAAPLPSGGDHALSSAIQAVFSSNAKSGNKCLGPVSSETLTMSPNFLISSMKDTSFSTSEVPETVTVPGSRLVATSLAPTTTTGPPHTTVSNAAGSAITCDDS